MALIRCPECGNMISEKAVKCPKCGYTVDQVEDSLPTRSFNDGGEEYYPEKSSSRKWIYVVIGLLAVVLVGVGILVYNKLSTAKGDSSTTSSEALVVSNGQKAETESENSQSATRQEESASNSAVTGTKSSLPIVENVDELCYWDLYEGTIGTYQVIFRNSDGIGEEGYWEGLAYKYTSIRVNKGDWIWCDYVGKSGEYTIWNERINGKVTGTFRVIMGVGTNTGTFTNSKGQNFKVHARLTSGARPTHIRRRASLVIKT